MWHCGAGIGLRHPGPAVEEERREGGLLEHNR